MFHHQVVNHLLNPKNIMEKFIQESLRLGLTPTFLNMLYGHETYVKNEFNDCIKQFCPANYEQFSLAARTEVIKETCAAIDNWEDCLKALQMQRAEIRLPQNEYTQIIRQPSFTLFKELVFLTENMLNSGKLENLQELRLWMRVGVNRDMIMYCVNRTLHYLCAYGPNIHHFHYVLENFPIRLSNNDQEAYLKRIDQRKEDFGSKEAYNKCRQIIRMRGIGSLV